MTRSEHICYCAEQAAICLEATCDESLSAVERLGAAIGEADWLSEQWALEQMDELAARPLEIMHDDYCLLMCELAAVELEEMG